MQKKNICFMQHAYLFAGSGTTPTGKTRDRPATAQHPRLDVGLDAEPVGVATQRPRLQFRHGRRRQGPRRIDARPRTRQGRTGTSERLPLQRR